MQNYSCGFIFNEKKNEVLLIRKNRPKWQCGMFNGIGGHAEGDETSYECMVRESKEETTIKDENWKYFANLKSRLSNVDFFSIFNQNFNEISPLTDELLYPIMIKEIFNRQYYFYNNIIPNLRVLIPLALDDSGLIIPVNFKEEI